MKEKLKKISDVCKLIFGYGIMITLFLGGLTFLGYVLALIIGGDTAASICSVMYERIFPVLIYSTAILVLFGLVTMYLAGEMALTTGKKKKKAKENKENKEALSPNNTEESNEEQKTNA